MNNDRVKNQFAQKGISDALTDWFSLQESI